MVEFVSWFAVAVIGIFSLVGFLGVVATSLLTAFRALRRPHAAEAAEPPRYASAA